VNVELIVFAIVAALSPLGLAAALAVITRGRLAALVFALAFVAAQLVACAVLVLADTALTPRGDRQHLPVLRSALELALGCALLCLAVIIRRRPADSGDGSSDAIPGFFDRLSRTSVGTTAGAGVLLGVGGPKRLLLTTLAAASITASGAQGSHAAVLVVNYTVIATLLVWAPVLAFEIAGDRVASGLRRGEGWLARRQRSLAFYSALTIGAFAVVDSLARLL
jgi:hypothetical protein